MKILHTADWHIGNFPGPELDGRNLRADDTGMCINHLHDIALLRQPDIILVSGDIFHQARVWADRGLHEVEVAIRAIDALSKICPVVVMRGTPNHDGEEQFSMLQAHFSGDDSVHVVTKPTVLAVKGYKLSHKWMNVACLPGFDRGVYRAKFPGLSKEEENQVFTEEISKIALALKAQCNPDFPSVLMSHYTVPGCNTESGQTQFLSQFEPVLLPDALDAAAFDLVALGHIHRPQQLESCHSVFYSGAINAMNFNDEGQKRGFWIHDLSTDQHCFYETPSREFLTIRLNPEAIEAYLICGFEAIASAHVYDAKDKIVRVLYSCTDEQNKALNRAQLEHELYKNCGAFWVSEISPEKVTIGTNKEELSDKTDPEMNLKMYLDEKGLPDSEVGEIVEAARPIIGAATAGSVSSQYAGAFIPVSIEVKNYRNYAEASFDFSDISFCTINGVNGAGKSSLFMDAILDCLFEEPREGDLTGWIRADEKARSGSICFTFSIGEHTFRITRTRAKSGKATLNISEKIGGAWENRSAEKIKDTQDIIEGILGMDSLTFRSCALIMQDQYGLFLQASKEDRMTILGNILGLGLYGTMEQISRNCATDTNRIIAQRKTEIATLSQDISSADVLEADFVETSGVADDVQKEIDTLTLQKENLSLKAAAKREAAEKAAKVDGSIFDAEAKKSELRRNMDTQAILLVGADSILSDEASIRAGAALHPHNLEEEKQLFAQQSAITAKLSALGHTQSEISACEAAVNALRTRKASIEEHKTSVEGLIAAAQKGEDAAEKIRAIQDSIKDEEEKQQRYQSKLLEQKKMLDDYGGARSSYESEAATRKALVEQYQAKAKMLDDSHCIDAQNASCRFLADAKRAKAQLETYLPECSAWKQQSLDVLENLKKQLEKQADDISAIGADSQKLLTLRTQAEHLRPAVAEFEKLQLYRDMVSRDTDSIAQVDKDLAAQTARIADLEKCKQEVKDLTDQKSAVFEKAAAVQAKIAISKAWAEKEAQLPLALERKEAAQRRIVELKSEIDSLDGKLIELREERESLSNDLLGGTELAEQLQAVSTSLATKQSYLTQLHTKIGGLRERLAQIEERKTEIASKQSDVNSLSHKSTIYETLKAAFSQDGIPHNIIRSMLPLLTSTANTILGQMTGGKMGMEFVTDKILKSNSKKEVPTLDIIIEEYGKDSLPYLSKSGGEKVKASLSAILSLAEIKSSQAGIQLGMLFIDEPPFLDADGIQAYCDALETIQSRYSSLKVMAITHDPTMKARFPQSIDIVKTAEGSKVELG